MIVRCIDNTLQADVLVEGREYEVRAERDDCYILSGFDKGFSKTRLRSFRSRTVAKMIKLMPLGALLTLN
jgi:hypothetical protein